MEGKTVTSTTADDCLGTRYGHYVLGNAIAVTVGSSIVAIKSGNAAEKSAPRTGTG